MILRQLIVVFVSGVICSSGYAQTIHTHEKNRDLCVQAMLALDSVYRINPVSTPDGVKLGEPILNQERLWLTIPVIEHTSPAFKPGIGWGIHVRFRDSLIENGHLSPFKTYVNLGISVHKSWSWPGSFPGEEQDRLMRMMLEAFQVLERAEANQASHYLKKDHYHLAGDSKLSFRLSPSDSLGDLSLLVKNNSFLSRQIARFHYQIYVDDTLFWSPTYFYAMMSQNTNPFQTLPGKGRLTLKPSLSSHFRKPGEYRVRVLVHAWETQWLDVTPTFVDGQPIMRKAVRPWTGISYSNEVRIRVTSDGKIEMLEE